ncbi:MAG: type II toxin-antitoxin system VapC family toxin [Chloroflexi bacterium]|nr:type II toxin-antitoxin system VapC family toxin [Chloroflexota bacterium]
MPAKVVDASVLGAMLFQEPDAEEAYALLSGGELFAPSLLPYELTSIARKKALRYPDQRDLVQRACEQGLALDITLVEVAHQAVLRLALETGLTTYDASYLYIARLLGAPLVTLDSSLQAAAQQRG